MAPSLKLARELLTSGAFAQADEMYRQLLGGNPQCSRAMLALSALMRRQGERKAARDLLRRAVDAQPLTPVGRQSSGRPAVYRARCIDSAAYRIVPDRRGGFKTLFKGGHFSTQHLLDDRAVNLFVANLRGGRTDALEQAAAPDIIINTIACADRGRRSLRALHGFLLKRPHLPIINRPEAVIATTRNGNYKRLDALEDVRFPRTRRLRVDAEPASVARRIAAGGVSFPVIVRVAGRQTGRNTHLCESGAALEAALASMPRGSDAYIINYADCRGGDGLHRKARAFFIDGRVYPVAYLASDEWQIHSGDRYRVMTGNSRLQEQERQYLADPEGAIGTRAWRALARVGAVLNLDFAGVDFTIAPDGALFVFEANPAMRHNFDHVTAFPYTRPYLQRISRAFDNMVHERIAPMTAAFCAA